MPPSTRTRPNNTPTPLNWERNRITQIRKTKRIAPDITHVAFVDVNKKIIPKSVKAESPGLTRITSVKELAKLFPVQIGVIQLDKDRNGLDQVTGRVDSMEQFDILVSYVDRPIKDA